MLSKLAKIPPQPLVLRRPVPPPAELLSIAKILPWLPITTATKRDIMLPSASSPRKMVQKTSDSLGNLRIGDWG